MKIPFNIPYSPENSKDFIIKSLESLQHCGNHSFGKECIELLKEKYGFHEVFLTSSCTSALEMGALLANINRNDEVILPSYTFSSTANAVVMRGAKPVFCEVTPNTMNIDVTKIEELITEKTRMICPIDYAGIPCDIDTIRSIAAKFDLIVMQDSAQSINSFHNDGQPCGSVPELATFSFHETKNISCGEGGALIVNNPDLVERAHFLQEKGTDRSLVIKGVKNKYSWVDLGSSFLLSDILSSLLLNQLYHIDDIVKKRGNVTIAYQELFGDYEKKGCLKIPIIPKGSKINNHAFFIIFDTEHNQKSFLSLLKEKQIYAYIGYMPLHSSPMGRKFGYKPNSLPITEDLASRIVRLPFYAELHGDALNYCITEMASVLKVIYD